MTALGFAPTFEPEKTEETDEGDSLDHYIHDCDVDLAMCGTDVSEATFAVFPRDSATACVVCLDVVDSNPHCCPRCGGSWR